MLDGKNLHTLVIERMSLLVVIIKKSACRIHPPACSHNTVLDGGCMSLDSEVGPWFSNAYGFSFARPSHMNCSLTLYKLST